MADDIIGTPVERVIPEGWHLLRDAVVQEGDLLEHHGLWKELDHNSVPMSTDADGMLWGCALVIRRNAPEPSVEKLRRERDEWKALTELQEVTVNNLKGKVAELEKENVRLGGLTGVVHDQEETVRWHRLRHLESTKQIDNLKAKVAELEAGDKEWEKAVNLLGGEITKHRKTIDAKDAEIERLKNDRLRVFAENGSLNSKLAAVEKALEGK